MGWSSIGAELSGRRAEREISLKRGKIAKWLIECCSIHARTNINSDYTIRQKGAVSLLPSTNHEVNSNSNTSSLVPTFILCMDEEKGQAASGQSVPHTDGRHRILNHPPNKHRVYRQRSRSRMRQRNQTYKEVVHCALVKWRSCLDLLNMFDREIDVESGNVGVQVLDFSSADNREDAGGLLHDICDCHWSRW